MTATTEFFEGLGARGHEPLLERATGTLAIELSNGKPLLLLRTMLGLAPQGDHLIVDPALAENIGLLALLDIPGRWGRVDAFARGRELIELQERGRRKLARA